MADVVRVGALCDWFTEADLVAELAAGPLLPKLAPGEEPEPAVAGPEAIPEAVENFRKGLSFNVSEFVDLSDGTRVTLHEDERGFGGSFGWDHVTIDRLRTNVLMTVLPDDDDDPEDHPWEWLAELARRKGVEVTADELRTVPYEVEFSERLLKRLERQR